MGAQDAQKRRLVEYLRRHSDRPVPAIELAEALSLGGNRERKRRTVREIVESLRTDGHRICAGHDQDGHGGYWRAASTEEWQAYLEARRRRARFEYVVARRAQEAVTDRMSGQGRLFADATTGW